VEKSDAHLLLPFQCQRHSLKPPSPSPPPLARAAIAVGVAGVFMETHPDPDNAPSDGPCMVKLPDMKGILEQLVAIDNLVKKVA
jgi:2-dehydro-3-deoxyphosphooctonate aldolase (KDO 8-P synthase)